MVIFIELILYRQTTDVEAVVPFGVYWKNNNMANNHLFRTVYMVFDELNGFRTKTGWTKSFTKAKIFAQRHHIMQTYDLKTALMKKDPTMRIVPIQMMIEEADHTALRLGGFLEEI